MRNSVGRTIIHRCDDVRVLADLLLLDGIDKEPNPTRSHKPRSAVRRARQCDWGNPRGLVRLNADGSLDADFNPGSLADLWRRRDSTRRPALHLLRNERSVGFQSEGFLDGDL